MAPAFLEPLLAGADPHSEEARDFAVNRLLYGAWGIPLTGAGALQSEIDEAGFVDVQLVQTPINRVVLARRPLAWSGLRG